MNRLDGKFLTVDDSLHVHQAGAVGSRTYAFKKYHKIANH